MKITVYRNSNIIEELSLLAGVFTKRLMAEHELVFTISTVSPLDLQVGDQVTYKGEIMTINKQPDVKRNHQFEYNIKFQGQRHTLSRFLIKDEGALVFDYSDTLETFMLMFIESINSVDSGWTIGELEAVEPFTVSFDKVDHLTALNMIAEACKCEWQIKNKTISIKKTVGQARNYPLAYGQHNGLYSIKRVSVENSMIVTRAFAVGGTQNLPASYAFKQFTLQGYDESSEAIEVFGVREGVFEDKEIYPRLINATVKAVDKINDLSFTITTDLDFDLNGQRIDGQELYLVFRSGMLTDRQFKILSYNHTTKVIRYEATKDDNGNIYPSGVSIAEVGDKYVLIGLRMPQSYVEAALAELAVKRTEYLASNKVPRVVYEAPIDVLDLKRKNTIIEEGDIIPFRDDQIGLNDNLRVTSVSYPACFPEVLFQGMTFTAEIGQEVTYTRVQKVEKDIKENKEVITQVTKKSYENDRRNVMAINEFKSKVFDPDGNLNEAMVQAISVLVGTDSMYYDLDPAPQFTLGSETFNLTATNLVHKKYKIDGLGYTWTIPSFNLTGLDPMKPYYLSAKCSKTTLTGEWELSLDPISVDSELGYWYFNLGILSSVIEGSRSFKSTKMFTLISGDSIETGTIDTDVLTAYMINVVKLFAQEIVATNIKITGDSKLGDWTVADDGYGFSKLNAESLYNSGNNVYNRKMSQSVEAITFKRQIFELGGISYPQRSVQIGFEESAPLWVDAAGDVGLHIYSGVIQMGDKVGYSGKFTTGTSPLFSHYNYRGGVLVEFIQNDSSTNPF